MRSVIAAALVLLVQTSLFQVGFAQEKVVDQKSTPKLVEKEFEVFETKVRLKVPEGYEFNTKEFVWKRSQGADFQINFKIFEADDLRSLAKDAPDKLLAQAKAKGQEGVIKSTISTFDGPLVNETGWRHSYWIASKKGFGEMPFRSTITKKIGGKKYLMLEIETTLEAKEDSPVSRSKPAAAFQKKVQEILDSFEIK